MSRHLTVPYTELAPLSPDQEKVYSPRLSTVLEYNNVRDKFSFHSVVDSGADHCVFPAIFGERLGIDIKSGLRSMMSGFGGGGHCFYHQLNVLVFINKRVWRFPCFAGFSTQMDDLGIGLLGRHGFFELFEEVAFNQRGRYFTLKVPGTATRDQDLK